MAESKINSTKKGFSIDWLMRGVLTKLGETFDNLTGRNWKPSSSLATSELIERLKLLLDADAKKTGDNKRFVPHHIQLKMQWDKFSTDAEAALKKLETELLIAAIDHINDKRYHTLAPLRLEIKPDYFTEGVRLQASFDGKFGDEAESNAAINVTVPDLKNIQLNPPQPEILAAPPKEIYIAEFTVKTAPRRKELAFAEKQRLSVGRTKENDLWIDDPSVSKIHAALVLNSDKQLMVADTGSTNGTFVNNQRISYGKAVVINDSDRLKFGTVEVSLAHIINEVIAADSANEKTSPDFSASDASTAREINSSDETVAEAVNQQNFDQTIKVTETLGTNSSGEIASENGDRQTGQNIVLDFEENK
jgi:pSer/pThr/pTyr-binding forkhead associated (FHA) protein